MLSLVVILMAYNTIATGPAPGTITALNHGNSVIRTDTRTGVMERCSILGDAVQCQRLAEVQKPPQQAAVQ